MDMDKLYMKTLFYLLSQELESNKVAKFANLYANNSSKHMGDCEKLQMDIERQEWLGDRRQENFRNKIYPKQNKIKQTKENHKKKPTKKKSNIREKTVLTLQI